MDAIDVGAAGLNDAALLRAAIALSRKAIAAGAISWGGVGCVEVSAPALEDEARAVFEDSPE